MHDLRLNPEQRLDLVVAGTKDAVMMVESEAYELSEEEMLGAVKFAHEQIQPVIDLIIDLAEDAAKEPFDFQPLTIPICPLLLQKAAGEERHARCFAITDKQERTTAVSAAAPRSSDALTEEQQADANLGSAMKGLRLASCAVTLSKPASASTVVRN